MLHVLVYVSWYNWFAPELSGQEIFLALLQCSSQFHSLPSSTKLWLSLELARSITHIIINRCLRKEKNQWYVPWIMCSVSSIVWSIVWSFICLVWSLYIICAVSSVTLCLLRSHYAVSFDHTTCVLWSCYITVVGYSNTAPFLVPTASSCWTQSYSTQVGWLG